MAMSLIEVFSYPWRLSTANAASRILVRVSAALVEWSVNTEWLFNQTTARVVKGSRWKFRDSRDYRPKGASVLRDSPDYRRSWCWRENRFMSRATEEVNRRMLRARDALDRAHA